MKSKYKVASYVEMLFDKEILIGYSISDELKELEVENIEFNSKEVSENSIFIVKGKNFKTKYLKEAIDRGAKIIVRSEYNFDSEALQMLKGKEVVVSNINLAMAYISYFFYNKPDEEINIIGITGTKGKSTTTFFLKSIIEDFMGEKRCGLSSGVYNYFGEEEIVSHLTTPEVLDLNKQLRKSIDNNFKHFVMEVSSQGLKYGRVENVNFKVGCFLNIGRDHISDIEHNSYEDYYVSKKKILNQSENICLNIDIPEYEELYLECKRNMVTKNIISFGRDDNATIRGYDIFNTEKGIGFTVKTPNEVENIKLSIKGVFNVDNALCAIAAAYALNIPMKNIKRGLSVATIPGRMEYFTNKDKTKHVIVDYAHNEMSFKALFQSVRGEYPNYKIYIVFGAPGIKALERRKVLGEIAGISADKSFITEEDYGVDSLEKICNEIATNVSNVGGKYEIIYDRKEAIEKAIGILDDKSILLVTGKGRETTQKRGVSYAKTQSDVEIVKKMLKIW